MAKTGIAIALFLVFKEISILFSIVAAPIYIPINNMGGGAGGGPKSDSCYPLTFLQLLAPMSAS